MSFNMEFSYYKEMEIAKKEGWPFLIPVGTMEYHSTHCPYGCDALVSMGIAQKIAEKIDVVVMPPIYYGVASYAVGGPEKYTIQVDCDTFENYMYAILKSLFKSGIHKNIYLVIAHQTEDYNPMELACMKAARKLIFEYLEETNGYGWWGNNGNKDFLDNPKGNDNPWNWVRVITGAGRNGGNTYMGMKGEIGENEDHAGKYECSELEALYPGIIKLDRLQDTDDWFAKNASEMSVELGKKGVAEIVDEHVKFIQSGKFEKIKERNKAK